MATRIRLVWSVLLVVLRLLAACGGAAPTSGPATAPQGEQPAPTTGTTAAQPSQPATVRIGWGGSPDTLNPGAAILAEAFETYFGWDVYRH